MPLVIHPSAQCYRLVDIHHLFFHAHKQKYFVPTHSKILSCWPENLYVNLDREMSFVMLYSGFKSDVGIKQEEKIQHKCCNDLKKFSELLLCQNFGTMYLMMRSAQWMDFSSWDRCTVFLFMVTHC